MFFHRGLNFPRFWVFFSPGLIWLGSIYIINNRGCGGPFSLCTLIHTGVFSVRISFCVFSLLTVEKRHKRQYGSRGKVSTRKNLIHLLKNIKINKKITSKLKEDLLLLSLPINFDSRKIFSGGNFPDTLCTINFRRGLTTIV